MNQALAPKGPGHWQSGHKEGDDALHAWIPMKRRGFTESRTAVLASARAVKMWVVAKSSWQWRHTEVFCLEHQNLENN